MKPGLRVLAFGWYGAGNIGDELLLDMLKTWVQAEGAELAALSLCPEHTRSLHGIEATDFFNLVDVAEALGGSDLFILGGGGLFQDHQAFTIPALFDFSRGADVSIYARPVLMAHQLGVPVVPWAMGVGPLDGEQGREITRGVFAEAAFASVRDEASAQLLRDIGVHRDLPVAPDPVWAYPVQPPATPGKATADRLAVILRSWPMEPTWEDCFIEAASAVLPETTTLVWIPFQAESVPDRSQSDEAFLRSLMERLPRHRHEWAAPDSFAALLDLMAGCEKAVCMRLHAQILALKLDLPMLCIEYDRKMSRVSEAVNLAPALRLRPGDPAISWRSAFSDLLAVGEAVSAETVARLAETALAHRELLQRALAATGKRSGPGLAAAAKFDWLGTWVQAQAGGYLVKIEQLNRDLDAQRRETAELKDRLAEGEWMFEQAREERTQEVQALQEALAVAQTALMATKSSLSWKLTKPLRFLADLLNLGT